MFSNLDENLNLKIISLLDPPSLNNYRQVNRSANQNFDTLIQTPSLITPLLVKHKGKLETFHYALSNNHPEIVSELLKHAPQSTFKSATHYAINKAAENGDESLLDSLINHLKPSKPTINHALLTAAEHSRPNMTRHLLTMHGADPNYENAYGTRPLESAISNNNLMIFNQLLQHNADIHYDNEFPLRLATTFDHAAIALALLHRGANINPPTESPLLLAIINQNAFLTLKYLKHGADPRVRNECPIRKAAWIGHLEIFQLLIAHGASLQHGLKIAKYKKQNHILEKITELTSTSRKYFENLSESNPT